MMASSKQCTLNTVLIEWMQTELLMLVCMRTHVCTVCMRADIPYQTL